MVDYDSAAMRYVAVVRGLTNKPHLKGNPSAGYPDGRMYARGDIGYSYGSHFEIARGLRDAKGELVAFLINGDTWGPTTGKHQRAVREAIARSGVPFVIIPFSALDSAGLSRDTIRLVDTLPDRTITRTDTRTTFPEGAVWQNDVVVDKRGRAEQRDRFGNAWVERFALPDALRWRYPYSRGLQVELLDKLVREDERRRDKHEVIVGRVDHIERRLYISRAAAKRGLSEWNAHTGPVWSITVRDDGTTVYTRSWDQHLLGESLITAEVPYTKIVRCPTCKGKRLAEEPWREEWAVNRYERDKRIWDKSHVEDEERRLVELAKWKTERPDAGWIPDWLTRPATPPVEPEWHSECRRCGGHGKITQAAKRTAYFLSGFDENEWPRISYFFCELPPKAKPLTVTEAYEALKPESVKLAEQLSRTVLRQGDIFAIELATTTRAELKRQGAVFSKGAYVFSTNHKATEVARLKDGTTIARGTLTHAPEGRRPDHKRVKLGKNWFVLAKNTVPLAK